MSVERKSVTQHRQEADLPGTDSRVRVSTEKTQPQGKMRKGPGRSQTRQHHDLLLHVWAGPPRDTVRGADTPRSFTPAEGVVVASVRLREAPALSPAFPAQGCVPEHAHTQVHMDSCTACPCQQRVDTDCPHGGRKQDWGCFMEKSSRCGKPVACCHLCAKKGETCVVRVHEVAQRSGRREGGDTGCLCGCGCTCGWLHHVEVLPVPNTRALRRKAQLWGFLSERREWEQSERLNPGKSCHRASRHRHGDLHVPSDGATARLWDSL